MKIELNLGNMVPPWAKELKGLMEKIMTAMDDLKAALVDLKTQLDANNAEIEVLLTKIAAPGATDTQIATAAQAIRELTAANKAEVDKAVAAAP